MRRIVTCIIGLVALVQLSGCATIVGGGSSQPISVQSTPGSASYTIQSSSGMQMAQGSTPATVSLPRDNEYSIEIDWEGYRSQSVVLTRGINGWIWGNLFVGWLVGFGIDFLTGSAYKLEPSLVQVSLEEAADETFAVIRLLTEEHEVLDEKRVRMVRER